MRRGHGHRDRFGIAHFAYQDHVGIFAHRRAHALGEGRQVRAELALDDLARLASVDELDRILEADDVERAGRVQMIDHRRERRRLARAGRARHQDHALVVIAELAHDGWQVQLIDARHLRGDRPEHRADAGLLAKDVGTEAAAVARDIGEIQIMARTQRRHLRLRQDLGDVAVELGLAEFAKLDRHQIAMHAQHRRDTDGEVQIRAPLRHPELEERVDSGHSELGYP